MVLQKNVLFEGTIAENLRWGNPDATMEEMKEAARLACAAYDVSAVEFDKALEMFNQCKSNAL